MVNFDLNNRVAIVTGGAQGFGFSITKRFLDSGAKVIIWDIDKKAIDEASKEISSEKCSYQVDDVKDDFTIMKQEPFGPLCPMVSFKTFDEVIERANNHELGLASYFCTNSMEQAHRASEQIETGTVGVNTPLVAIAEAPFGGIKQTGYAREGGSMAIKDYLNVKYTHLGIKG